MPDSPLLHPSAAGLFTGQDDETPAVFMAPTHPMSLRDGKRPWIVRYAVVLAAAWALLSAGLAIVLSVYHPSLGMRLQAVGNAVTVESVRSDGPAAAAGLVPGTRVLSIGAAAGATTIDLEPADLVEDPDLFHSYAQWGRFYERQGALMRVLAEPMVLVTVAGPGNAPAETLTLMPSSERSLRELPLAFWFQLVVQALGVLAAGWVMSVYPLRAATLCSGLAGLTVSTMLTVAAVVSGRELALPPTLTHALSTTQHLVGALSLLSLAGVVTWLPRRPFPAGAPWWPAVLALYLLWALANAIWWLPSPNWAVRPMLLSGVALVVVQLVRQWRASAHSRNDRATLRAIGIPWAVGLSFLVGGQEGLLMLGLTPPVAQAWMFGLALLTTVGATLGVRNLRLFDLDEWSLHLLLTWGAGIGVLSIYQLLTAVSGLHETLAMLLALLLFGVLYVPLVSWLWRSARKRRGPSARELTGGILMIGLTSMPARLPLWESLLRDAFRARSCTHMATNDPGRASWRVTVGSSGTTMSLPPLGGMPGLLLRERDHGARLFSRTDQRLAQRLWDVVAQMIQTQEAYSRGVTEERQRIADDLHDDLGATLLTLVHASESGARPPRELARLGRQALDEMRLAVRNLKAAPAPAADVLADWRAETVSRLESVGVQAHWHADMPAEDALVPVRVVADGTRVLREAVSNVIRHSGARACWVDIVLRGDRLNLVIEDDGVGLHDDAQTGLRGHGLVTIERRVRRLNGQRAFAPRPGGGTRLSVSLPLHGVPTRRV